MRHLHRCILLVLLSTPLLAEELTHEQTEFFESKVRPILVENCYKCHSVDAEELEASLFLDSKWGWETGGDSGPAIVPGELEDSILVDAIRYTEDIVSGMPPRSKLPEKQIKILEQWIAMGAPDPRPKATRSDHSKVEAFDLKKRHQDHWSWRAIAKHQPPAVKNTSWSINDIDRFILARIEEAGLQPAVPADKRTWIRRVYFDLIGLPPTQQQIANFLSDDSADAHRRVVTGLLELPQFGEKWARHWMDLVRYAETYGHEFDYPINHAHEYRDYLIRALNADVPYDQFVREHIAGDLMDQPRRHPTEGWNESIIGTGFWYFHEATHAPTDVLGNEADIIDNQIDVFGKAFLGLTIACARCHDHKFDAISTADYYALSAYIQASCRQEAPLDPGNRIEKTTDEINRLCRQAAKQLSGIDSHVEETLKPDTEHRFTTSTWDDSKEESVLFADFDSEKLPRGWSTSGFAFQPVGKETSLAADGRIAFPGSVDSGLFGKKQYGILRSPTFEITTQQIHVRMKATANITMRVVVDNYQMAHFNGLLFKGTFLNGKETDTDGKWVWKSLAGDLRKYVGHKAYLEFIDHGDATIAIDEIRFAEQLRSNTTTEAIDDFNHQLREGLGGLREGRTSPFIAAMFDAGLLTLADLSPDANETLSAAAKLAENLKAPRFAVAMAQGSPEDANVYVRGSHVNLGDPVPARFLEALGGQQVSRLQLADLVASPENPLTARVIVNRLWHHLLGRGIVPTVDEFGPQGQRPTHPELLDWLAADFIANGWSLKKSIREIVLSQTYRQSSVANADVDVKKIATTDPTNSLLHRMRVRRLPSESIRDAVLLVSGRLDPKQFGPSVATHRTPFMTGRGARPSGPLDGDGRRSIYVSIYRNFLNPFMLTFDMPSPFGPKGQRSQSNVPAQALTLMNDPMVVQQTEIWAKNILAQSDLTDAQRIAAMVQQSHGTEPTPDDVAALDSFLTRQAEIYGKRDHRAWSDLGHALLNMKAFYFVK